VAVYALATSGQSVYAAGFFSQAGGIAVYNVAKWDGSAWAPLGGGIKGTQSGVYALALMGNDLYAGGEFALDFGPPLTRMARWDGTNWSVLGSGMNNTVRALAVSGTNLIAGGAFTSASGVAANRIARWDGSGWSALGSGMNTSVLSLHVSGPNLYAGGNFTLAGGKASAYLAQAYLIAPPGGVVESIAASNGTAKIGFYGNPGHYFDIQRSTNLIPPAQWITLTTNALSPAADGSMVFDDADAPVGCAYYRSVQREYDH
jgi:hypothetical protein